MYSERKLRYDRSIIYKFYLCVLLVVSALLFSDKVIAETWRNMLRIRYRKMYLKSCQRGRVEKIQR